MKKSKIDLKDWARIEYNQAYLEAQKNQNNVQSKWKMDIKDLENDKMQRTILEDEKILAVKTEIEEIKKYAIVQIKQYNVGLPIVVYDEFSQSKIKALEKYIEERTEYLVGYHNHNKALRD